MRQNDQIGDVKTTRKLIILIFDYHLSFDWEVMTEFDVEECVLHAEVDRLDTIFTYTFAWKNPWSDSCGQCTYLMFAIFYESYLTKTVLDNVIFNLQKKTE